MERMIYTAMNGAKQSLRQQDTVANNIANISTPGFRADLHQLMSVPVEGGYHETRVYPRTISSGFNTYPGPINTTGNPYDIAVQGEGWISVLGPDGKEAYTRAGQLSVNRDGMLLSGTKHPVMGQGGVITVPPSDLFYITSSGGVFIQPEGGTPDDITQINQIKLVNPPREILEKNTFGLIVRKDGVPAEPSETVHLIPESLEGSNVNPAHALLEMIEVGRQYDVQVKTLQTAKQRGEALAQILQI